MRAVRIKQKPEDFVVREAWRFDEARRGEHYVYLMDKQKLSTLEAVERIAKAVGAPTRDISFCGLKDKQGRTEQIVAIKGRRAEMQAPDLRLKFLGRTKAPLSSANLTANRFVVTVRDLSIEEAERVPASVAEVSRVGVVNYFDSQRFGGVKHGQGFLAKDLAFGRVERALHGYMAQPSELDRSEDAKVKAFWHQHWGDWEARPPHQAARRYRTIVERLRKDPKNWVKAFRAIDKRVRAMMVFEFQSYLWNESVRRYLLGRLGPRGHLVLRYQAGHQLFPREVRDAERLESLRRMRFPLVGPDSTFDEPEVRKAVEDSLAREHVTLEQLGLEAIPDMGFKHELRPLVVRPGKLSVVDPRPDEVNRGRLKVTLAFTLPPGAYATLVVRRTLWFAMDDVVEAGGPIPPPAPDFVPEEVLQALQLAASRPSRRRPPKPSHGLAAEDAGRKGRPGRKAARTGEAAAPKREKPARPRAEVAPARKAPTPEPPAEAEAPRPTKKAHRKGAGAGKGSARKAPSEGGGAKKKAGAGKGRAAQKPARKGGAKKAEAAPKKARPEKKVHRKGGGAKKRAAERADAAKGQPPGED